MSSDKGKKSKKSKGDGKGKKLKKAKKSKKLTPKKTCCKSKPRCKRCPIRMLADGRLDPADAKKLFAKSRNRKQAKKAHLDIPGE